MRSLVTIKKLKEIKDLAGIALGVLAISILLGLAAHIHHHWVPELFTNFQIQYAVGGLILSLFFLALKDLKLGLVSSLLCAVSLFQIYDSYDFVKGASYTEEGNTFKVIQYNRKYRIENQEELLAFIKDEKPNVAFIQEATASHSEALKSILDEYPYQIHEPRERAFGMVVISNLPLISHSVKNLERIAINNIRIKIEVQPDGLDPISIYGVHPPPPMSKNANLQRNSDLLTTENDVIADKNENIILLGDWNMAPFSPHFKSLIRNTDLKNQFTSPLMFPTWPSMFVLPVFQIPIDHILHKGQLQLIEKRRAHAFGSDHYPIVASYSVSATD